MEDKCQINNEEVMKKACIGLLTVAGFTPKSCRFWIDEKWCIMPSCHWPADDSGFFKDKSGIEYVFQIAGGSWQDAWRYISQKYTYGNMPYGLAKKFSDPDWPPSIEKACLVAEMSGALNEDWMA